MTPTGNGNHVTEYLNNIRRGIRASTHLIIQGFAVFSPFIDFSYWLTLYPGEAITEDMIKAHSMAWLEVSHAVLVLPKWENSIGTIKEIKRAEELGMPVFYDTVKLLAWRDIQEGHR